MKIISVVNQKGGVGKTTTTIHLARSLAENDLKTIVLDLDPQASLTMHVNECAIEQPFKAVSRRNPDLKLEIEAHSVDNHVLIADCRPDIGADTKTLLEISDLVIVPLIPGGYELKSTAALIVEIEKAKETNTKLIAKSLLNSVNKRFILTRVIDKALEKTTLKPYKTHISNSQLLPQLVLSNELIHDVKMDFRAKKITHQYRLLAKEVITDLLGNQ